MDDIENQERDRVISEARTWLRTPYHHCAKVKGHGVDCATLLKCVFENVGQVPPIDIPDYSPQWFLHRDAELYMERVMMHAKEIAEKDAQFADVVLWKMGRTFAHGAIIMPPGWPSIIHADSDSGCVVLGRGIDGRLGDVKRPRKFFTRW